MLFQFINEICKLFIYFYCLSDECHLVPLLKIAREIEDWEMLGTYLGIKNVVLKDIKHDNQHQSGPARKDMLMKWLEGGKATKADFIEALKNMNQFRLVHQIESLEGKLCLYHNKA